ncbi:MAG: TolC family protein [Deltaproteobacteria bacterium]|nr:TolC family protein [Deltaproteobacteria bacterium]
MPAFTRTAKPLIPALLLLLAAAPAAFAASKTAKTSGASKPPAAPPVKGVTMYETVERAFAYNPDLKAAQEARWGKFHDIDRARAGYYPKVAVFSGAGFSQRSDPMSRAAKEYDRMHGTAEGSLRITQPLWYGGATTADVATRTAAFDASDKLLDDRAGALAFESLLAHIEVLRWRDLLRLAKENLKNHEEVFGIVRLRFRQNIATAGEMHQVEGRLHRAKGTLASHVASLDAADSHYLRLTGRQPAAILTPAPPPRAAYPDAEDVRLACVAAHPRLAAAMADIRASQGERDFARSNFLPRIDVDAGPRLYDRNSKNDLHENGADVMLRMRWELFSGGADAAALRMTSAKIRQARQTLYTVMDMLNEDIEATFSRRLSSIEQDREYGKAMQSARLTRQDYQVQFEAGRRGLIDVLDAVNDYFYAASQQVISKGDTVIAAYRLLNLGGALLAELGIRAEDLRPQTAAADGAQDVDPRFAAWTTLTRKQKGNSGQ